MATVKTASMTNVYGLDRLNVSTGSLSAVSMVKQTETPRKLKSNDQDRATEVAGRNCEDNQSEGDDDYLFPTNLHRRLPQTIPGELDPSAVKSGEFGRRTCFSPRPKRLTAARRPIQSASSILRVVQEQDDEGFEDDDENGDSQENDVIEACEQKKCDSFRMGNQQALEHIEEAESADEQEQDEDDDSDNDGVYDGDEEDDESTILQLYKSFSGEPLVRYDSDSVRKAHQISSVARTTHLSYDDEDDDVVRISA